MSLSFIILKIIVPLKHILNYMIHNQNIVLKSTEKRNVLFVA